MDQCAQSSRRVLDGAALRQRDRSEHGELIIVVPHILQDRLLAPGQRRGASLCSSELDDHSVLTGLLEHI